MSEVRLRTRKDRANRVREFQGMLAMQGLVEEAEQEQEIEPASEASSEAIEPYFQRADDVKALPYRVVLASWPDDWRERWGRRANELEDAGLSWRDAEGRAFFETWSEHRAAHGVQRN